MVKYPKNLACISMGEFDQVVKEGKKCGERVFPKERSVVMDKKLIITINREYGSGGKKIGQRLSKLLGIPYYDEDIITMASEHSAVAEEFFRLNDEKPGKNILKRIIGGIRSAVEKPSLGEDITSPDNLFRFQSEVIRKLAEEDSCILIGRCSDFVLEESAFPDVIRIFVYADLPKKIENVMEVDGVDTKEALNRVQRINKKRSDYYRYYTGESWDDMTRYDLPVNTSKLSFDEATSLILHYLKIRGFEV